MKYVYLFKEGKGSMKELLGGKGANLAEMTNLGMPVPRGFTITTEACTQYYQDGQNISPEIQAEIMEYVKKLKQERNSVTRKIPCWCRFVPAPEHPCPG
jgi:pyruvate,orthophosphate dikinase